MKRSTHRRNLNRGYMKLEVWQRAMDLFELAYAQAQKVSDFKLRSQFSDATQSVSANIAVGYCRRTLPEYVHLLYVAKGSLGECLSRALGLLNVNILAPEDFEALDVLHYEVENKLLALIKRLEAMRDTGEWQGSLPA
jgi:four helix bundle protein